MREKWRGLVMGLIVGSVAVFLTGSTVTRNLAIDSTYTSLRLFNEVLSLIQKSYVDEVDTPDLMEGAYEGMLAGLDPYSEYLTAEEYAALQEAAKRPAGRDADVGVRVARKEGVVLIVAVKPGSEAAKAGITPGDLLRRIGEDSARDLALHEIQGRLSGPAGSSVLVHVARREEPRKIETNLERRATPLPAPTLRVVDAAQGIAVLTVPHFEQGVTASLASQLEKVQKQNVRRLLIDLRGNAWGTMEEAARAAGLFMGDTVVARIKGKGEAGKDLRSGRGRGAYAGKVAILVNASTAEAAEMFAAALRDGREAPVLGETTFGVGAEQELIPLDNGAYLKLSTRKYVSPSGNAWHGTGLKPGVVVAAGFDPITPAQRLEKQLDQAVERLRAEPWPPAASSRAAEGSPGGL